MSNLYFRTCAAAAVEAQVGPTLACQAMAAGSSTDANVPVEELALQDRVAVLELKVEDQAWLSRAERTAMSEMKSEMGKMDRQLRDCVHVVDWREFRHCMHVSIKDLRNKVNKMQEDLTDLKIALNSMEAAGKSGDDGGRGKKRAAREMVGEEGVEEGASGAAALASPVVETPEQATNRVLKEIAVRNGTYRPPSPS